MTISVITTTHDRPLCLSLLFRWLCRQSVKADQHLIVSDGLDKPKLRPHEGPETPLKWKVSGAHRTAKAGAVELHARKPKDGEGLSIKENWLYALNKISGDKVLVCEDDDWYNPDYVRVMSDALDRAELVGVAGDYYWNWRHRKYVRVHNAENASLAATGFRRSLLLQLFQIVEWTQDVWIDRRVWADMVTNARELVPNKAADGRALHVGFKCMPGAKGLGAYHGEQGVPDPSGEQLRAWIGLQDALVYQRLSP